MADKKTPLESENQPTSATATGVSEASGQPRKPAIQSTEVTFALSTQRK